MYTFITLHVGRIRLVITGLGGRFGINGPSAVLKISKLPN